jgi:hypothetical protein
MLIWSFTVLYLNFIIDDLLNFLLIFTQDNILGQKKKYVCFRLHGLQN